MEWRPGQYVDGDFYVEHPAASLRRSLGVDGRSPDATGRRGYEAGPEGLEILVIDAPDLGEDPRSDVEGRRNWWAD